MIGTGGGTIAGAEGRLGGAAAAAAAAATAAAVAVCMKASNFSISPSGAQQTCPLVQWKRV